jgi:tetratricopeptide (TPR) repeat protein
MPSHCNALDSEKEAFSIYEDARRYEMKKNIEKAVELYQKAYGVSQDENFKKTMLELIAQLYSKMKKYKDAEEIYNKLLKETSNSFETVKQKVKIAYLYVNQKRYSEAFKILDDIIEGYPKEKYPGTSFAADAQFSKAAIYYRFMRDFEKAILEYQKMVENFPDDWRVMKEPYSIINIAYCYIELKRYDDAIKEYQEIINAFPKTKWEKFGNLNIRILNEYYKKGQIPKPEEIKNLFEGAGL